MAAWYEEYLGRPWAPVPNPPESFTCGELVRYIYRKEFGFETLPIPVPDARDLKDCVKAMDPTYFGLVPIDGEIQEMDAAFLMRRHLMDHCGLVVLPGDGVWILHCSQRGGVQLSSLAELEAEGYFRRTYWRCPKGNLFSPLTRTASPEGKPLEEAVPQKAFPPGEGAERSEAEEVTAHSEGVRP